MDRYRFVSAGTKFTQGSVEEALVRAESLCARAHPLPSVLDGEHPTGAHALVSVVMLTLQVQDAVANALDVASAWAFSIMISFGVAGDGLSAHFSGAL